MLTHVDLLSRSERMRIHYKHMIIRIVDHWLHTPLWNYFPQPMHMMRRLGRKIKKPKCEDRRIAEIHRCPLDCTHKAHAPSCECFTWADGATECHSKCLKPVTKASVARDSAAGILHNHRCTIGLRSRASRRCRE